MEHMENKYWKKLCTPEQNKKQIAALIVLAVGLTLVYLISLFSS